MEQKLKICVTYFGESDHFIREPVEIQNDLYFFEEMMIRDLHDLSISHFFMDIFVDDKLVFSTRPAVM